jgi:hypothetical protein
LVHDARLARRAKQPPVPDRNLIARSRLKSAPAIDDGAVKTDADGLAVLVVRRNAEGSLTIVAALSGDAKLTQQVVIAAGQ